MLVWTDRNTQQRFDLCLHSIRDVLHSRSGHGHNTYHVCYNDVTLVKQRIAVAVVWGQVIVKTSSSSGSICPCVVVQIKMSR